MAATALALALAKNDSERFGFNTQTNSDATQPHRKSEQKSFKYTK
jgi:hypothetical protein